MADYRLHCFPESGNTYKVALYLECAGLEWEKVFVDYFNGVTREQGWRDSLNELGEVPVLETAGKRLTQSGAILTYLAETTGKFAPKGDDQRYEVLRWLLFDNHKFTSYFATYRFLFSIAPEPGEPAVMAFLKGRADGAFAIVERHLADSDFIAGGAPTIADFSMAGYVFYPPEEHGYDFATTHPNMRRWMDRLQALPGWQPPRELMKAPA